MELQIMEKMTQFDIALNSVTLRHVGLWICNGCAHCKKEYVMVGPSGWNEANGGPSKIIQIKTD